MAKGRCPYKSFFVDLVTLGPLMGQARAQTNARVTIW